MVTGHVENDAWTGKDGVIHYDLRLIVEQIRLKDRRDGGRTSAPEPQSDALQPSEQDDESPF